MQTPEEKILRLREVLSRTGLCRSTIYALVSKKQFPPPINLGARAVGWLDSDVSAWIAQRVANSRLKQRAEA